MVDFHVIEKTQIFGWKDTSLNIFFSFFLRRLGYSNTCSFAFSQLLKAPSLTTPKQFTMSCYSYPPFSRLFKPQNMITDCAKLFPEKPPAKNRPLAVLFSSSVCCVCLEHRSLLGEKNFDLEITSLPSFDARSPVPQVGDCNTHIQMALKIPSSIPHYRITNKPLEDLSNPPIGFPFQGWHLHLAQVSSMNLIFF